MGYEGDQVDADGADGNGNAEVIRRKPCVVVQKNDYLYHRPMKLTDNI